MIAFTKKYKVIITIVLIQLIFVRYLILTPLNLNLYARYIHLLVFVFLAYLSIVNLFSEKYHATKLFLWSLAISLFAILMTSLQHYIAKYLFSTDVLPNFASTHIAISFIPMILFNFDREEIKHIINRLTMTICIIGPLYFFVFYYLIYRLNYPAADLLTMLLGKDAASLYGQNYVLNTDNIRQIGFLMIHDRSGAGLTAAFYYQFYFLTEKIHIKRYASILEIFFVFFCILGIIYSTSLTVIIASLVMFALITTHRFGFSIKNILMNLLIIFISLLITFINKGVWDRVKIVHKAQDYYIKSFFPGSTGCQAKYLIWRFNTPEAISNIGTPCVFNEVFSLWPIVKYGFLPMLPWFIIFLSPLASFFKFKSLDNFQKASLCLIISFWICGLHFSGAEFWGNNLIFFLAWIILFSKTEVSV